MLKISIIDISLKIAHYSHISQGLSNMWPLLINPHGQHYKLIKLHWTCNISGPRFNIKMTSYQYRKSHCGDKTILRPSYLHNGISYTGKTTSLYWIRAQIIQLTHEWQLIYQSLSISIGRVVLCKVTAALPQVSRGVQVVPLAQNMLIEKNQFWSCQTIF